MDANVNLKRNESLRKLKIMNNNKIYRAYEIEFPKELKPTYDFLQGKLLEILTNTHYYDLFNNFPIYDDDGKLIHKGIFWQISRSLFPENYFDTWNLGGNAWYFRMILDTIWRALISLDSKRKLYDILKQHEFKLTKALREELCRKKLYPTNKELKNLIAYRAYPNLSKELTFIMDFSVSSPSTLKKVSENHYKLRVDKTTWCDYRILIPLSVRLELTGELAKPSFRRTASGKYHGMCSYEVKPVDMNLEDNVLGIDLGFVKLFSAVVLKTDDSLSREYTNSERSQALYRKLKRIYESKNLLHQRMSKSKITDYHIYTKNLRRSAEFENLKTKIRNIKKTLMEELAAETISLALREKCNIIKVEDLGVMSNITGKWNYGHYHKKLKDLAELYGINIIKVSPANTSKKHPVTKEIGVLRGRNIVFSDGKKYDRDYIAAINIALRVHGRKHNERVITTLGRKKKSEQFKSKISNKKRKQQRLIKTQITKSFNQSKVREIVTYCHKDNELSLNYAVVLSYDSVMSNYRHKMPILAHKYYLNS